MAKPGLRYEKITADTWTKNQKATMIETKSTPKKVEIHLFYLNLNISFLFTSKEKFHPVNCLFWRMLEKTKNVRKKPSLFVSLSRFMISVSHDDE
jgi:hypothetical protein